MGTYLTEFAFNLPQSINVPYPIFYINTVSFRLNVGDVDIYFFRNLLPFYCFYIYINMIFFIIYMKYTKFFKIYYISYS